MTQDSNNYFWENWNLRGYSIFKEDDKLKVSVFFNVRYPNMKVKKIALKRFNFRIIFNCKTGQTYIMEARECDGTKKRPKEWIGPRIANVTYSGEGTVNAAVFDILRTTQLLEDIAKELASIYNLSEDVFYFDKNDTLFAGNSKIRFRRLTLFNKLHKVSINKNFYDIFENTVSNDHFDTGGIRKGKKIKKYCNDLLSAKTQEDMFSVIDKQFHVPSKKRLKKIIFDNPLIINYYKTVSELGFSDYNIIMNIMENHGGMLAKIDSNNEDVLVFVKDMIALKGESVAKKMIFGKNEDMILKDAARMYVRVKKENVLSKSDLKGTLKEIHDKLCIAYKKVINPNQVIEYTEEELALCDEIDGYTFMLANDTNKLIDVGQYMGICVGSYGHRAARKYLLIVIMSQGGKFVGCIELSRDAKRLVQAKAKYNNKIQEYKAEALQKWVTKKKINAKECYDYSHILSGNICYDEDAIYLSSHNYANYGMNFNEHLNTPFN